METERLFTRLLNAKSMIDFFERYNDFLTKKETFSVYINRLRRAKGLRKSQVVSGSSLEKSYTYELFNGKKNNPSRNKVIMLAFGLTLDARETQSLLKHIGYAPLDPKDKRDAIIIYSLSRGISITAMNLMLDNHNQELLA